MWIWQNSLSRPPVTGDAQTDQALNQYAIYYPNEWPPNQEKILECNYFNNDRPRTTNVCEGWSSSLRLHFDYCHPKLGLFISKIKLIQAYVDMHAEKNDCHASFLYINLILSLQSKQV